MGRETPLFQSSETSPGTPTVGAVRSPLVSVAIITYNQAQYIAKALESVLSQEANFAFEVIVGDDSSTDATSDICRDYAQRYPGHLTHLLHASNRGYIANLISVIEHCNGKYVALLEADDHWISNTKLSEQVEVFEKHSDVSLCFTNSAIDDVQVPENVQYFTRTTDMLFDYADCLKHMVAPTSTFMFRRNLFVPPAWFRNLATYEYFLIYLLAARGPIYYLNRITACRTQHYRGQSILSLNHCVARLSEVRHLNHVLAAYDPEQRKSSRNTALETQLNAVPYLISEGRLGLGWKAIRETQIWKVAPDTQRSRLIARYVKELARLVLSTLGGKRLACRKVCYTPMRGQAQF